MAILKWVQETGIGWHYIAPGKPTQKHSSKASTANPEMNCLNETLFGSLAGAKETLEAWQDDYNRHGPHSALRNLTPLEFAEKIKMDRLAA